MSVKLYHILPPGDPYGGSRNAAKAAIALREAGVSFETLNMSREKDLRPVDGAYRRDINPNGVTPTLDDDGFLLWESAAVLTYIADKWASGVLISKDIREKARVHQWLAWEGATFQPGLLGVFLLVAAGDQGSDALISARARYNDNLAILNNALTADDYVAGNFSVADIALGCSVSIGFHLGVDLSPYSMVASWLRRLKSRSAFVSEASFSGDVKAGEEGGLM
jgi:glutathione S-transferase